LLRWITDRVAIGSWKDAEDYDRLSMEGIEAILDLGWHEPHPHEGFVYRWNLIWPVHPKLNPDQVKSALTWLLNQVFIKRRRVLVHCGDGIERAPTIVMLFLYVTGFSINDALSIIKRKAPETQPRVDWCDRDLMKEIHGYIMRHITFEQAHFRRWYRQGESLLSIEYGAVYDYGTESRFSIHRWAPEATTINMMYHDTERLPFNSESFDSVCFIDSLSMMPNPLGILKEARRVLKDGGRLFIQNIHGVKIQKYFYQNELNLWLLSEITLRRILNQAGFFVDYCQKWAANVLAYATKTDRRNEDLRLIGPIEAHEVVEFFREAGVEAYPSGGVFRWGFSAQDVDVHIVKDEEGKCEDLVMRCAGALFPCSITVECHTCKKKYHIDPKGTITVGEYYPRPLDLDLEMAKHIYRMGYTIRSYWEKLISGARPYGTLEWTNFISKVKEKKK